MRGSVKKILNKVISYDDVKLLGNLPKDHTEGMIERERKNIWNSLNWIARTKLRKKYA